MEQGQRSIQPHMGLDSPKGLEEDRVGETGQEGEVDTPSCVWPPVLPDFVEKELS